MNNIDPLQPYADKLNSHLDALEVSLSGIQEKIVDQAFQKKYQKLNDYPEIPELTEDLGLIERKIQQIKTEIQSKGLKEDQKETIVMMTDAFLKAKELLNEKSSYQSASQKGNFKDLADTLSRGAMDIRKAVLDVREKEIKSYASKAELQIKKVDEYIQKNNIFEMIAEKRFYSKEETGLQNSFQLVLPQGVKTKPGEILVLVHLKPEEPVTYQERKRNVVPLGGGAYKVIRLSVGYRGSVQNFNLYATAGQVDKDEMKMLERFKGQEGIAQLIGHAIHTRDGKKKTNMVMTYGEKNLKELIESEELSESSRINKAKELLKGLRAIHKQGIMHLDIKLENVLIVDGKCQIADFGLSIDALGNDNIPPVEKMKQIRGTIPYWSPEMHRFMQKSELMLLWHQQLKRDFGVELPFNKFVKLTQDELKELLPSIETIKERYNGRERVRFMVARNKFLADFSKYAVGFNKASYLIGPMTDVYSMGIVLFEMKHGKPPVASIDDFNFARNAEKLEKWHKSYKPIDNEDKIIHQMLHPDPMERLDAKKAFDLYTT